MLINNVLETPEAALEKMRPGLLFGPGAKTAVLEALRGEDAERVAAFLIAHQGVNQETGFKKFCATCNDYTGTMALPLEDWYFEMCLRKPQVRAWRVLIRRLPPFGRAVLAPPYMDDRAALSLVLRVAESGYFTRCVEIWAKKKILEREKQIIQELKEEAKRGESRAPRADSPPADAGGEDAKRGDGSGFTRLE